MTRTLALLSLATIAGVLLAGCSADAGASANSKDAPNYKATPTLPPPSMAMGGGAGKPGASAKAQPD